MGRVAGAVYLARPQPEELVGGIYGTDWYYYTKYCTPCLQRNSLAWLLAEKTLSHTFHWSSLHM